MSKINLSPIVLFVYNRPWHTKKTIEALRSNNLASESDLFIFSDGPKEGEDIKDVIKVRDYIKSVTGFRSVKIIERVNNIGLAQSVILGVTEVVKKFGSVIVLEDDLVTSPSFLSYMNQALNMYKDYKMVGSVNSLPWPIKDSLPQSFFLKISNSWGWGTWSDRWLKFNPDATFLYEEIKRKKLVKEFNIDGLYPFFQMLKGQIKGLNNSWAIRWYASLFLSEKINLFYGKPLVKNIGFDGSGVHCGSKNLFKNYIYNDSIGEMSFIEPVETLSVSNKLKKYFKAPKMFVVLKLIKIRNFFRILLIDLNIKKKK